MLTITISFYTSLKEDSNGMFKAMWANIVMSDFTTKLYVDMIKKKNNIGVSEKLKYRKILSYLFSTTQIEIR